MGKRWWTVRVRASGMLLQDRRYAESSEEALELAIQQWLDEGELPRGGTVLRVTVIGDKCVA